MHDVQIERGVALDLLPMHSQIATPIINPGNNPVIHIDADGLI